ncbi:MAG: hypothetical protein NVS3B5_03890 [Sphingomicrobium sp.]
MPYFYALAEQNGRLGDPILRPVFYDYPSALKSGCDQSWTFTLGKALLIAPPPSPESPQSYDVCLPAGGWYDYWSGRRVGSQSGAPPVIQSATQATGESRPVEERVRETPSLASLPVFVRAGTILPRQAVVQSTSEKPSGPLLLDVYPGADCAGALYDDDGHSMAYTRGGYLRQGIRCDVTPDGLRIKFGERQGNFKPWWQQIQVIIHGWTGEGRVQVAMKNATSVPDVAAQTLTFSLPDEATDTEILVKHRP